MRLRVVLAVFLDESVEQAVDVSVVVVDVLHHGIMVTVAFHMSLDHTRSREAVTRRRRLGRYAHRIKHGRVNRA